MHRAQVLLEEWQYDMLKSSAQRRGESVSALLRQILTDRFSRNRPGSGALADIDGVVSDPGTRGRDHDQYLYGRKNR